MYVKGKKRAVVLCCTFIFMLGFLGIRLYKLSEGNYSRQVLSGQYTRKIDVVSRDAVIYDKNMIPLSHKRQGCVVLINPMGITQSIREVAFEAGKVCEQYTSTEIANALSKGECVKLFCKDNVDISPLKSMDGIYVFDVLKQQTTAAQHLIGYENSDKEGVCGLKKELGDVLERLSGSVHAVFQSNAMSGMMPDSEFKVDTGNYEDYSGIVLTIDKNLQSFVEDLEGEYIDRGAVVVTNVQTGEILACASFPSYDENNIEKYLESDRGELVNRVTKTYTPGSVFKLVVAAAALEKSQRYSDFTYECTGLIQVSENKFKCHKTDGHGVQNLEQAFANSCNCYFVEIGQRIGAGQILKTARKMGIGKSVLADFLQSSPANLPDEKNVSDTLLANISFGQGTLLLSPLDMVNVINSCATGYLPKLRLIKGVYEEKKQAESPFDEQKSVLKGKTVEKLKSMMGKCVTDGTGKAAYIDSVPNGGKTATAQTGQKGQNNEEILHKWFCGIYPKNQPKVSIIVFCDGTGRTKALPAEIFGIVNKFVVNSGIVDF